MNPYIPLFRVVRRPGVGEGWRLAEVFDLEFDVFLNDDGKGLCFGSRGELERCGELRERR